MSTWNSHKAQLQETLLNETIRYIEENPDRQREIIFNFIDECDRLDIRLSYKQAIILIKEKMS